MSSSLIIPSTTLFHNHQTSVEMLVFDNHFYFDFIGVHRDFNTKREKVKIIYNLNMHLHLLSIQILFPFINTSKYNVSLFLSILKL